jgi:hypothetical protein
MDRRDRNLVVRLPDNVDRWIGIDELKKIRVDVADPVGCRKVRGIALDDLLRKTR